MLGHAVSLFEWSMLLFATTTALFSMITPKVKNWAVALPLSLLVFLPVITKAEDSGSFHEEIIRSDR